MTTDLEQRIRRHLQAQARARASHEAVREDPEGRPGMEGKALDAERRRLARIRPPDARFVLTEERDQALRWAHEQGMARPSIRDTRLLRVSTAFLVTDGGRVKAVCLVAGSEVYGAVQGGKGALRFWRELPSLITDHKGRTP